MRRLTFNLTLALALTACCSHGKTIRLLGDTIKDSRTLLLPKAVLHEDKDKAARLRKSWVDRYESAERLAAVALGEDK